MMYKRCLAELTCLGIFKFNLTWSLYLFAFILAGALTFAFGKLGHG